MARPAVLNFGLVLFFCWLLRCTWAGYCDETFTCVKYVSRLESYRTRCGGWWLWPKHCDRYRSRTSTTLSTCTRRTCCPGYVNPSCARPVCFGSTTCPNGGTCVTPNNCACPSGYSTPRCADINECSISNGGCQHICRNSPGSFRCHCQPGYTLGADGNTCTPVCFGSQTCPNGGTCVTPNNCACPSGYSTPLCADINECSISNGGCQHICSNSPGSFRCHCQPGYKLGADGNTCTTVCFGSQTCPNGGTCVTPDNCLCPSGYSTPLCADINECSISNGGCQHICSNSPGSFRCHCLSGYTLGADGNTCTNINECATNNGGCHHMCIDRPGSYECECYTGYRLNDNGNTCSDINECQEGLSGCSQICTNTPGSFRCSCNTGYVASGKTCDDIDECVESTAGCSHVCHNYPGSYTCSCNDGFRLENDNTTCTAIQLCSTAANTCEQQCIDEPGSFSCQCTPGYRLNSDGATCSDIDECRENTARCSQTCSNTVGSFECSCSPGFRLADDGRTCFIVDDCASDPCTNDGTCVDHELRYICYCAPGYTGSRCEDDVNECAYINGGCQDVCTNNNGSFSCSCPDGGTLAADGFTCTGKTADDISVFQRYNIVRAFLPRGCHEVILTYCPDGKDIEVRLSSTSQWYNLTTVAQIYSPGIIFAEVNDLSIPVSLSGVTVTLQNTTDFKISLGVGDLTPEDGDPVGTPRSGDCLSMNFTSDDVYEFKSANSFLNTIFDRIFKVLPDFLQLTGVDSNIVDVANLKTDFVYGSSMDFMTWCEGAPVLDDHLYIVFRFESNFQLSIYGNTVNIPKPLQNKNFCLIIDMCHNQGGSVFLMIPEGSRDFLMSFDFFKKIKDNLHLSILPRGLGISLVKGVGVRSFDTQLQLWNGDNIFTYQTFGRGDAWFGGNIIYDTDIFNLKAAVDTFLSVPNPVKILTGAFIKEWNVLAHVGVSQSSLKFRLFMEDFEVPFLDRETTSIDVYLSVGGLKDRTWCGHGSSTDITNPPGAFFAMVATVNPFQNIPILGDWILEASTRLHGYFTTGNLHTVSPNNSISIVDDVLQLNETMNRLDTFLDGLLQSITVSFLKATSNHVAQIKTVVAETKQILLVHRVELLQGNVANLQNLLPKIWGQLVKIRNNVHNFIDAIEFIMSDAKNDIINFLKEEIGALKRNTDAAVKKLYNHVTTGLQNYSAFGAKFAAKMTIFGLNLGELDIELSISTDIVARCSRFDEVYDLLKRESAVRFLARFSRNETLGYFMSAKAGAGLVGAFGMETNNAIVQIHAFVRILGISTTADVFLSRNGLYAYLEGNLWNIFLVQVDVAATSGDEWHKLTFTLKGRFIAKARPRRQILRQGNYFQSSYVDALTQLTMNVANETDKRLKHVQDALIKAQNGLTKAQNWFDNKEEDVRTAYVGFNLSVARLETFKQDLEDAKGPYEEALVNLTAAQKNVDSLCRFKDCREICIPVRKYKICSKIFWFGRIWYPCCWWTGCMFSLPDPSCVSANAVCREIRAQAYAALEAAELFVKVPMLALDAAKRLVSAEKIKVNISRVSLVIVEGVLELANGELELAKEILDAAKLALEGVKFAIRGAVKVLELVLQYGSKTLFDVRNCGFEVEMSTTDLPVFEVSCEVNAFRLGWTTVIMRIDFRNAFQTIWRAAKATIDDIVSWFKNVSDRRRREINYESSMKMHKLLRKLRQANDNVTEPGILDEIINVVNQSTGMRENISESYESRQTWFNDKCDAFKPLETFLLESLGALLEIANESKSSMELPSNITEASGRFDLEKSMREMTPESAEIDVDYGYTVYNLSKEAIEEAFSDAKMNIYDDPVAREVLNATHMVDAFIEDEIKNIDTLSIIDYWKLAMQNGSASYFSEDECSGFEDCLFYAVSNLYSLYEDEYDLPNITQIRELISLLETNTLALIHNKATTVGVTFDLADSAYSSMQSLAKLTVFCSDAPHFISSFKNVTVLPGSNSSLSCMSDANPIATVWWFKNGQLLPGKTGETIKFVNATVEDSGIFMCTAGNIVANISSPEVTLTVADAKELCLELEDEPLATDDGYCRTYVKCYQSGIATPMCCRRGRMFDIDKGGCVTTNLTTCTQEDCPDGHDEGCTRDAADGPSTYYDREINEEVPCPENHIFDLEACQCKALPIVSSGAYRINSGNFCFLRVVSVIYLYTRYIV